MLKVDRNMLAELDREHPGFRDTVRHLEATVLPPCHFCHSADTAIAESVTVPEAPSLAFVSTKVRLVFGGPLPGAYYCNTCGEYFG